MNDDEMRLAIQSIPKHPPEGFYCRDCSLAIAKHFYEQGQKELASWILGNFSLDKALLDCLVEIGEKGLLQ